MSLTAIFYPASDVYNVDKAVSVARGVLSQGFEPRMVVSDSELVSKEVAGQWRRVFGEYVPTDVEGTLDLLDPVEQIVLPDGFDALGRFAFTGIDHFDSEDKTLAFVARLPSIYANVRILAGEEFVHIPPAHALAMTFDVVSWADVRKPEKRYLIPAASMV